MTHPAANMSNSAPDNLDVALKLAKAGLPIFPVAVTFNANKQKWDKAPCVKGWQQEASTDEQKLRGWWRVFPAAVPGIELGRAGLVVIDTDRHGGEDGVAAFAGLVAQHVPLPEHPIAKTAGDGEHHYFRQWSGEAFGNSEGLLRGKQINVRGRGGFAVAPGSVRPDGKRWGAARLSKAYPENKIPTLPDWIAAMIRASRSPERLGSFGQAHHSPADRSLWSPAEEARLRDALAYISSEDRSTWFEVGAALHQTGWDCAREIWDAWSQTTPGSFDADDQEKTWRSFDRPFAGKPKTLASLFYLAQGNGWSFSDAPAEAKLSQNNSGSVSEPLPTDLFDPWQRYIAPAFPLDVLPPILKHFVAAESALIGCDRGALAMSALAAVSGALDHRFALKLMRHGNWWASPRLWVLLVGDPSVKKTPIINCATSELDRPHASAWQKYQDDKAAYVAAGGDEKNFKAPPAKSVVYDTTIEKLGIILSKQDRGVLIKRDEISGWIGSMEKYSSGGRGSAVDRAFWLKAFDGGPYTVDRVSRPDLLIPNLSVSIVGGIQPGRLAELHGLTSDGLLQRFLPVLVSASTFPDDAPTTIYAERYGQLLVHLTGLSPQKLQLSVDALGPMEALRQSLFDLEQHASGMTDGFQGFVGKLAGYAGGLALNLAMAADPRRPIGSPISAAVVEDVACLIKQYLLPHAFEFYSSGASGGERLRVLASYILTSGKQRIVPSDLTTNVRDFRGLGLWDVNQRLSPLVAGGWLAPADAAPVARVWNVNPQVYSVFAERARDEERRKAAVAALMNSPRRPQAAADAAS
jgi:Protein of unknown function (DUF3987)/Bifunctional DNA primase/polymerase, N-terminal/Primase C terminal 2 (PriCT-2)